MNLLQKGLVSMIAVGAMSGLFAVEFEITPTVGKMVGPKDTTLNDSKTLMGIRGTAYVTPNVGIQAVAESSLKNRTLGGGDTDIERGAVNVVLQKPFEKVTPYVTGGVGYEWTHGNTVKLTNDDSQVFYNAGAGVKVNVNDRVNVMAELKGIHKVENSDDDLIATVGVGMKVGAVAQKAPTCQTTKALSLQEFSKMCKTKTVAPAPMAEAPVAVTQMQSEPQVVSEEVVEEPEVVPGEVLESETCVVETDTESATETADIPEGYYVQMAALFKSSGDILTSKLERKNYPYVIYETSRGSKDVKLVLVGPYQSRKEAKVALRYLKRLSRGAFVKRFP
jgi:cell division septation protein DedD